MKTGFFVKAILVLSFCSLPLLAQEIEEANEKEAIVK
jgi:hypothetical protein